MTDATLLENVKKQVEFYFSDAAYRRDNFLKTAAANDAEGFVPIATLLTFKKLKQLTEDEKVVAEALADSDVVTVSEDKTKLKKAIPLPETDDSALRTLYVKGYPRDETEVTIDSVREQFSVYGPINYVKLRREAGAFKGSCFIEFAKEEDLQKAYKAANEGGSVQLGFKGTPFLCVIPFNEWQANHNSKVKLGKRKQANESKEDDEDAANEDEEAAANKGDGYTKGLLLEVENLPSDFNPRGFREFLGTHADVAYVEKSGDGKAIIRFKSVEQLNKLQEAIKAGLHFPEGTEGKLGALAVSEEAEKSFYDRLKANQGNNGGRGNKGGRGGGFRGHNKRQRR